MSSKSVELRKLLQEIAAMEVLVATKKRVAGRMALELQELYPEDWCQRVKLNKREAREVLESVTQTDPSHGRRPAG